MDYLISIQDSINTVNNALMEWSCMEPWRDAKIVDSLHDIPPAQPADVVEVVRCKDCKYHGATIEEQPTPSIMCAHMHDNDYCSYGKRREDE